MKTQEDVDIYLAELQAKATRQQAAWDWFEAQVAHWPPANTKVRVHCHMCVFFTYDDKILKEHIDEEHSKTSWR